MSAKNAILQTWEITELKQSSLHFLRESSNLGHCLYNNIRELLQTVFPKGRISSKMAGPGLAISGARRPQ
jgi:hypothetical protein